MGPAEPSAGTTAAEMGPVGPGANTIGEAVRHDVTEFRRHRFT